MASTPNMTVKPIVVALMGVRGRDRRLFCDTIVESLPSPISDGPVTQSSCVVKGTLGGTPVWLIDSPSNVESDAELLRTIRKELEAAQGPGKTEVHGVIYLQNIQKAITPRTANKNATTFNKLLTPAFRSNVVIVTTPSLQQRLPVPTRRPSVDAYSSIKPGHHAEASLQNTYSMFLPQVIIRKIKDSRDDEHVYHRILQEFITKIKGRIQEGELVPPPSPPRNALTPEQLSGIVDEKDEEIASLWDVIQALTKVCDRQTSDLQNQKDTMQTMSEQLAQTNRQVQQLTTKFDQQYAKLFSEYDSIRQDHSFEQDHLKSRFGSLEQDHKTTIERLQKQIVTGLEQQKINWGVALATMQKQYSNEQGDFDTKLEKLEQNHSESQQQLKAEWEHLTAKWTAESTSIRKIHNTERQDLIARLGALKQDQTDLERRLMSELEEQKIEYAQRSIDSLSIRQRSNSEQQDLTAKLIKLEQDYKNLRQELAMGLEQQKAKWDTEAQDIRQACESEHRNFSVLLGKMETDQKSSQQTLTGDLEHQRIEWGTEVRNIRHKCDCETQSLSVKLGNLQSEQEGLQQQLVELLDQRDKYDTSSMRPNFENDLETIVATITKLEQDHSTLERQVDNWRRNTELEAQTPKQLSKSFLNTLDSKGEFPLYRAAAEGRYGESQCLLEQGADPCLRTPHRWTSLHWAAANGHPRVVRLLLDYGADVNAASDTGRTPLSMAKTEEIRSLLEGHGGKEFS
ncbi:Protein TANC2 [Cladobotryum mycophilum]|uniref:Protein TANC2 n=1 Tax=Cladobotryum mycophilum TaxID=491253 RepID=A0ABR0SR66_9HYPO